MAHKQDIESFPLAMTIARRRLMLWVHAHRSPAHAAHDMAAAGALAAAVLYAVAVMLVPGVPVLHTLQLALSVPASVAINGVLLLLSALHFHFVQRPSLLGAGRHGKPQAQLGADYRLLSAALLFGFFFAWQPLPQAVWSLTVPWTSAVLWAGWSLGWVLLLGAIVLAEAPVLRRPLLRLRAVRILAGGTHRDMALGGRMLIRFGLSSGLLLIEWSTPQMNLGHLLFAGGVTLCVACAGGVQKLHASHGAGGTLP